MDSIRGLRDRISIPTLSTERLYSLLALVIMIAIGLGDVFFVRSYIVPRLEDRKNLDAQLTSAREELEKAKIAQEKSPEELRKRLEEEENKLNEVASAFLSDTQASEALNRLYQYASESLVEIANLQTQPVSEEEKGTYDVRKFRLQANGSLSNLMSFISRIKEAALESFVITNVNITEGEEQHALSMDITIYTSPYSSGAAGQATPGVTPPAAPTSLAQLTEELDAAWESSDWEQVIGLIKQILAIDPDYEGMIEKLYSAYVNYGYQLLGSGNPDEATVQFNNALGIKPDGPEALAGLEQATAWVSTPGVATPGTPVSTPGTVAPGTPEPTPPPTPTGTPMPTLTVEEQLEQSLDEPWAEEDWEEVIKIVEQILAINPDYDDMTEKLYAAHVNYGLQLADEGELEKAKEEFTHALSIKPEGGEARAGLQALSSGTPMPGQTPAPESQYIIHVVEAGENLFRIALEHGTTVEAIMAANGLTNNTIHVGQELRIPVQ